MLRAGGGMAAIAALSPYGALLARATEAGAAQPGSLPDPSRPAGVATDALPFDHIVIVMMENHSFDNYLGMLPRRGKPGVDGFSFDATGAPADSNPVAGGFITVKRAASRCQPDGPSQAWTPTHQEIDGGRMDGFARVAPASMLYWDADDIPFYYSLARTFCVGDRWFCSAPCQTYPNRRFLLAGTAFGLISTDTSSLTQNPPNGTIVDRLVAHGISWRDYFTDLPATGVIESIPQNHPANLAPISQFYADCAAGTLPAVSFVDSDIGAASVAGGEVGSAPAPFAPQAGDQASTQNQDEEGPADITLGENFVSQVTNAVLRSPAWPRTLLVWTYDEHGGYYDHVPPPAAIPPDSIQPRLGPHDTPGGYDIYGPRVPAVVVSPYSKRAGVTSVVHDHTSILATIEAKWNLPAMTFRDANANTLADFLDPEPAFLEPPTLAAPGDIASSESTCSLAEPTFTVHGAPGGRVGSGTSGRAGALLVRFLGRRTHVRGVLVQLRMTSGTLAGLTVELVGGHGRVVASTKVGRLGTRTHRIALRRHRGHIADGVYRLVVKRGRRTLYAGRVKVTSRHRAARQGEAAT